MNRYFKFEMKEEEILERLLTYQIKFLTEEVREFVLSSSFIYENRKQYHRFVKILTEETYSKFKSEINPNNLERSWTSKIKGSKKRKSKIYQLDHKFSISKGFKEKISPILISSKFNLEMLTKRENKLKRDACSITLLELESLFNLKS